MNFIHSILGRIQPRRVDSILASLNATLAQLEQADQKLIAKATKIQDRADRLEARAAAHVTEAYRAGRVANKLRALVS